jgi:undecaprenyl-diphosphatase
LTLLQIFVLAVVQGITEFLPISSAGHLVLVPVVFGWPDQGVTIDIAVHVGTLGAVVLYLWREVWMMLVGLARLAGGRVDEGARLAFHVVIATIPVLIAGFLVKTAFPDGIRSALVIGWAFVGFGIILYISDRNGMTVRRMEHMTVGKALLIGIAQCFALIPGASRSGTTITMARMLGFERRDAARFSMLMSIPAIMGAGLLQGLDLAKSGNAELQASSVVAAALAFVSAFVAILAMMGWLRRASFTPFVVYRLIVGAAILWIAYRAVT